MKFDTSSYMVWIVGILQIFIHRTDGQQCQCVSPEVAANYNCLGYDSKMQAATLDEAIASFPDLSLDGIPNTDTSTNRLETAAIFQSTTADPGCVSEECKDCQKQLRKRLQKIGLLAPDINSIITANTNSTTTCKKYRFTLEKDQKNLRENQSEDDDSSDSSEEDEEKEVHKKKEKKEKSRREKRQAQGTGGITSATDPTIIGTRFTISCAVKGVSVDPTGTVSLCSSCWVWRKLPDNYRPQYVNELVCNTSDTACLSGYATCSVGHRTFEAVRYENGVNTTVSLQAGSYCECRITTGSSLQSLVNGAGISGVFTPLAPKPTLASGGVV